MASRGISSIYDCCMALGSLGEMGGKLLFVAGLNDEGTALTIAGNIAGAATLAVEPDASVAREAVRNGVCDFSVNSLDESLRILKNEIRKKQPVSVCLLANAGAVREEMVERGVQPDLLAAADEEFLKRGALRVPRLTAQPPGISWSVQQPSTLSLEAVDRIAADSLEQDGAHDPRLRWLRLAPRYLGRARRSERYLRMTEQEWERFYTSLLSASNGLPSGLLIERDGRQLPVSS